MKKMRGLCVVLGLAVVAFGLLAAGCGKKEAAPAESTAVETVAETKDPFSLGNRDVVVATDAPRVDVISEEDGAYVGTTPSGETQYAFDKYGSLGKEVWDSIAQQWTTRTIDTESDLRALMDSTYGQLSTKEELTQDILILARDPQPVQESLAVAQSKPAPKETKAQETKAAPNETKPQQSTSKEPSKETSKESQSTPEIQSTQPNQQNTDHGLIPGTNYPSTGDPAIDEIIKANNANVSELDEKKAADNSPKEYEDQGKGLNWN